MARNVTKLDRVIRAPEFARRIEQAADMHNRCPQIHLGRLRWISEEMEKRGHRISTETVRKWFYGEARPRPEKARVLAELLEVDPAWLQLGVDANLTPRERKVRNATVNGAVNVLTGIIQMDGGHPAFPDETDERARNEHVDIYAIIRGANYAIHVTHGEVQGRKASFAVPFDITDNVIVIGVVREGLAFDLFEITPEIIAEYGKPQGASTVVTVDGVKLKRITGFSERL